MLREPLHIFSIPPPVLHALAPRASQLLAVPSNTPPRLPSPAPPQTLSATNGALSCNLCFGATFSDVDEQRSHFRSDWHRYNMKARLRDGKSQPVAEAEFANLVDGFSSFLTALSIALSQSLSGSASSSSDGESEGSSSTDKVTALLKKNKGQQDASQSSDNGQRAPRSPVVWFQSPDLPDTQLGVYTALFDIGLPQEHYVSALREMQHGGEEGRTWALFMTAGGHFAGMIVQVGRPGEPGEGTPDAGKKKGKAHAKPEVEILKHKTFHRYTTRRKQGGSQSVNDNAKGPAKSAGAQLRRYGEQALRDDIRGLMTEWSEEIASCERIFIRANVANRRIFLDHPESIIPRGDPRMRTFPFPTRRPTQAELTRCLTELTRVKISHLTEDALRALDEAHLAAHQKSKPVLPKAPAQPAPEKKKPAKLSKDEELARDKWRRLLEMIRKGREDALKAFWEKEGPGLGGVDAEIPGWLREEEGKGCSGTILQVASASGNEEIVRWMLFDLGADPTVPVPTTYVPDAPPPSASVMDDQDQGGDSDAGGSVSTAGSTHRTAYDLASSRGIRNVFRRCAYAHPDRWDWLGAARVPSILTPDMEAEQDKKKGIRKRGLKERMKEKEEIARAKHAESEKLRLEEEREASERAKAESLKARLSSLSGGRDGLAGLSPEMRAKIERERRARAAEARLKTLGGK
ncbi:hypothetical protein BOTBODRAFT_103232 [Botryobasidium botryosum FD-172 SS1]|uniref:VLRF1 domain-containing protein n=1 Tax=Botryobasidium botryosum (strain FD-172 SS1) TaxID=930990 RepID=A0A067MWK2_BOTB1|nr:hypothetical protein BOTBODRAFT_103232 [Botryobasidium botryosum FD-172 SS1]